MEQKLRFGLDLGQLAVKNWVSLKFYVGLEIFSVVSCSNRDTSPRDLSIMTLVDKKDFLKNINL